MIKNIIVIFSVLVCVLLLIVGIIIKPTIVNTEYTITIDKAITGSDKEILSQELEKYKDDLKLNYAENIEQLNNKFNMLLALVGIAVTVWVGLNIYNLVDRAQIDNLAKKQKEITENITSIAASIDKFNVEIKEISIEIESIESEKQDLQQSFKEVNESIDNLIKITRDLDERKLDLNSSLRSGFYKG